MNNGCAFGPGPLEQNTQRNQRVEHAVDVICMEQPFDARIAMRERREQQHPVRDALRARQLHAAGHAAHRLEVEIVLRGAAGVSFVNRGHG
jgi:hypothetical protein